MSSVILNILITQPLLQFHFTHPVCLVFFVYCACALISLWSFCIHLCIRLQIMGRMPKKVKLNFNYCAARK